MQKKFTFPGESIAEILIAIAILAVMLSSTFSMLNRAVASNINVTQRVMALNIAREGLEGVRSIRDTNWLKYSGAIRDKWLCWEEYDRIAGTFSDCMGTTFSTLSTGAYRLDFADFNGQPRYFLDAVTDPAVETQLYSDSLGRYTHAADDGLGGAYALTDFSRSIDLEIIPTPNCGVNPCSSPTQMRVVSSVSWNELSGERRVTLETVLFDFLNRTEY